MTATASAVMAERLADRLRDAGVQTPHVAAVLGSGLGAFAESLEDPLRVSFEELEDMPRSTVPGHAGAFVAGRLGDVQVLVQAGRIHLYEGWSADAVTLAVRAIAALGCPALLLTNAAGGLRPEWEPGTLMRIEDHLNLTGRTPLARSESASGQVWSSSLGAELDAAARESEVELRSGVYAALSGPSYETPAEVRALREFGADAVGMSTALEALVAAASGMQVAGVSCITNHAAGIGSEPLDHEEVIEIGRRSADRFARLVAAALPRMASSAARELPDSGGRG